MSEATTLTPARGYHHSGVGHCNAAEIVHDYLQKNGTARTDSTWISLQRIIGFAAENTLKAYLAVSGVTRAELSSKKYGHNLQALYDEALVRGLKQVGDRVGQPELADALRTFIELCGADYQSFNYRYIEGPELQVLTAGDATTTPIRVLRYILDAVEIMLPADQVEAVVHGA
ncbi:hypothetical protein QC756_01335 [Sinorhizobium meliloti]|uniref:hypothetical protein n=1 Tax=Rhizobium meliloti TaxID=382 RepID=UPI00244DB1C8|nr:hypothetical protein [Sinorhizobium meliloti]WGI74538.1 hypothetical protein QC756_01335 [Sinorhizobium meliloti]